MQKLFLLVLLSFSLLGKQAGNTVPNPNPQQGLPFYPLATSPLNQTCLTGYDVVKFATSSGIQIYTCGGGGTPNVYGLPPTGVATSFSGPLQGTVTGNQTTTALVGVQTVDGVNNATIAAAIAAAGTTGSVHIPPTYPCTENWQITSGNPNHVPVWDERICTQTTYSVKRFGAKGDGFTIGTCTFTAGIYTINCNNGGAQAYSFAATDVGKVIVVNFAVGTSPALNNADQVLITTIVSVAAGIATMAAAPTVNSTASGNAHYAWLTTDDTTAFTAWTTFLNSVAVNYGGAPVGYIPSGHYWVNGTQYLTQAVLVYGDGVESSYVINGNTSGADLFFVTGATNTISKTQFQNFSIQGIGAPTTGNLLVYANNMNLINMQFSSCGGRAILAGNEQSSLFQTKIISCRQAYATTGGNTAVNETYISDSSFDNDGLSFNNLFGVNTWNWNRNSSNGTFPSSGALIADQHAIVELDNTSNFVVQHTSIKPLALAAIHARSGSGMKLQNDYLEAFTNGYSSPAFIAGGAHETTTLASAMTTSQTTAVITNGQWMLGGIGNSSDISKIGAGGVQYVIYCSDYVYGSTAASTACGGSFQQGYSEIVTANGLVNSAGTWTIYITARGATGSTGTYAWPSGAIVEQLWSSSGASVVDVDSTHLSNSGNTGTGYTFTCAPSSQETCATLVTGAEPDTYFLWGSANQIASTYAVNLAGSTLVLKGAGMTAAEAHGGSVISTTIAGTATSNPITSTSIYIPGMADTVNRPIYTSNSQGGNLTVRDPNLIAYAAGTSTNPVYGNYGLVGYNAIGSGNLTGTGLSFKNTYCQTDDYQTTPAGPVSRFCFLGYNAGTNAAINYDLYNTPGSAWVNVFKLKPSYTNSTATAQLQINSILGIGATPFISGYVIKSGSASNTDLVGQVTLSSGTQTQAFTGTYTSAPLCMTQDQTTYTNASKGVVTGSGSSWTLTVTGTGTDVVNYSCIGRN